MSASNLEDTWYGARSPSIVLRAAAALYGALACAHQRLYRHGMLHRVRLPVPVVIVGNIAVGGTGKTPLTLWLAEGLARAGRRPGIVCRAYAARARTPSRVAAGDDPAQKGDEAVLMAQRAPCPVWSGPKRSKTAAAMLAAHSDIDVVLCDDGLQHHALLRDVEIAVVDGARAFGNGRLLPAGPLRERPDRLEHVHAIVIHGEPGVKDLPGSVPHFRMALRGERFTSLLHPELHRDAKAFAGKRLAAIAGIGNPDRFFTQLRRLGLDVTATAFPDHHRYVASDLAGIDADCVLMTEKDAIKCARFADERMWVLPVQADVESALLQAVLGRIDGRPAPPPSPPASA